MAVARAMMSAPRLLMLDEPRLAWPKMIDELAIARRIADAGTTVLMVEAERAQGARRWPTAASVLERGELYVASGPAFCWRAPASSATPTSVRARPDRFLKPFTRRPTCPTCRC